MTTNYIDFRLFPDIEFNGNSYSNYDTLSQRMIENTNIPLLRAYRHAKDISKLLLIGEGSLGKSTSLRVFRSEMLYKNKTCFLYECKSVNLNDITSIESRLRQHRTGILIFDAYDELQELVRESFNELLDKLNKYEIQVIVSCRFDPRTGYVSEATNKIFSAYQPMYISAFTDEQLDSLVSKQISRNSGYYKLLKNTMFLSLHLELEKNNLLGELKDSVKTEAAFIQQYFERLYFDKRSDEIMPSDLINLGRYVHSQRLQEANTFKRNKKRKHTLNCEKERIPEPLKHILEYENYSENKDSETEIRLVSKQVKYLNYLHGLYLKKQLLEIYNENDGEELLFCLSKLLNMPSTSETSESIYYAGQLLADHVAAESIFAELNEPEAKSKMRYENVLCLFLGYNNDVADDIPGVFEFYHPTMIDNYHNYLHVCDRIRELKANSIKDVKFGSAGFPQLEAIDVNNEVYYSKGNCLIQRSAFAGLYLGCINSEIPEEVRFIHSPGFSCCDHKSIIIPPNVKEIASRAFMYCRKLEYIELGEGVDKVAANAIYKCPALKTVCIKNKKMETAENAYDRAAFADTPNLEKAIIPTCGIQYMDIVAPLSLKYLDICQGETAYSLVPLTFEDVKRTFRFKELVIRRDVEHIADDAFYQIKNNFERIYVEPECVAYSSIDNCLISNKDKAIILGCKNSIIPSTGIKEIRNYAFARCDIENVDITEDVESIGVHAFYNCPKLTKVSFFGKHLTIHDGVFRSDRKIKTVAVDALDAWLTYDFKSNSSNPLLYAEELIVDGKTVEDLIIPNVTSICDKSFIYAKNIRTLHVPPCIRLIGAHAFAECSNLTKIYIEDLNSWCNIEFTLCSSNPLVSGAALYLNGSEIRDLVIDSKISLIKKNAFYKCSSIQSVTFTNEQTVVESEAFVKCPNLRTVKFEKVNYNITADAFRGNELVVFFPGTIAEWAARYSKLKGVKKAVCSDGEYMSRE